MNTIIIITSNLISEIKLKNIYYLLTERPFLGIFYASKRNLCLLYHKNRHMRRVELTLCMQKTLLNLRLKCIIFMILVTQAGIFPYKLFRTHFEYQFLCRITFNVVFIISAPKEVQIFPRRSVLMSRSTS